LYSISPIGEIPPLNHPLIYLFSAASDWSRDCLVSASETGHFSEWQRHMAQRA
jgi:hypothetical protein